MSKPKVTLIYALSILAFGAFAGELSTAPGRIVGFGPAIKNDPTLNANLGVLRQKIAWLNSPLSDVFQVRRTTVEDENFDSVAMLSSASDALGRWANIRDDVSLNHSNGVLSQVIAWQNSPAGDAFLVAQNEPEVTGADFQRVALASIRYGSEGIVAQ